MTKPPTGAADYGQPTAGVVKPRGQAPIGATLARWVDRLRATTPARWGSSAHLRGWSPAGIAGEREAIRLTHIAFYHYRLTWSSPSRLTYLRDRDLAYDIEMSPMT
ncbi:hypothetical protein GW17_00052701 [Ensete ventricosum]|nr:hypothetical protein GW17_00052701 [Ensete ventricosum]